MDWKDNINSIKQVYSRHFQIILNFATIDFLPYVLSNDYQYVWVYNHSTRDSLEWKNYTLPLFDNKEYHSVKARNINFSYSLEVGEFRAILPRLGSGITLSQVKKLPNYYLDPVRITGKSRYDLLLKECEYLFEIDIPSAKDYGTLISANRDFLQSLLDNKEINWNDLP
jgi:hypothetical protein